MAPEMETEEAVETVAIVEEPAEVVVEATPEVEVAEETKTEE